MNSFLAKAFLSTQNGLNITLKYHSFIVYSIMEITSHSNEFPENETFTIEVIGKTSTSNHSNNGNTKAQIILTMQSTTASIGIVANFTVIVVFLNHKKLRRKIPNIFIINQVGNINGQNFWHCI